MADDCVRGFLRQSRGLAIATSKSRHQTLRLALNTTTFTAHKQKRKQNKHLLRPDKKALGKLGDMDYHYLRRGPCKPGGRMPGD